MSAIEQILTLTLGLIVVVACTAIALYTIKQIAGQAFGRPSQR